MTKIERLIYTSSPASFLVRKSREWSLPGLNGLPLYDVINFFFRQVKKVGLTERASAISFNLIMAMPAALLFLFSLVPYFPVSWRFKFQILRLFKDITPNSSTYEFVKNIVFNDLFELKVGVFSFGFVLLMFYASNAMLGIIRTFDKSILEHKAFFFHKRWRAIKLTGILLVLVIASMLVLIGQQQMRGLFNIKRGEDIAWWNWLRWGIIVIMVFGSISFIYKYAPSVMKRWKLISAGSLLATVLMLVTAILFSWWVNNFASYNKIYGSIGTVLIIMVLVYINSFILLIGFEVNVTITYLTKAAEEKRLKEIALPG